MKEEEDDYVNFDEEPEEKKNDSVNAKEDVKEGYVKLNIKHISYFQKFI